MDSWTDITVKEEEVDCDELTLLSREERETFATLNDKSRMHNPRVITAKRVLQPDPRTIIGIVGPGDIQLTNHVAQEDDESSSAVDDEQSPEVVDLEGEFFDAVEVIDLDQEPSIPKPPIVTKDTTIKYILITVSTIGTGKTTTGVTLSNLLPRKIAHIQNDDIAASENTKITLIKRSLEALKTHDAVIIDRNNPRFDERWQIFRDISNLREYYFEDDIVLKFVCLNFIKNPGLLSNDEFWSITTQRVELRGNNHQSIKADTFGTHKTQSIMNDFIERFQPLDRRRKPDSIFHKVINLDVTRGHDSTLKISKLIIRELQQTFPGFISEIPSDEDFERSYQVALSYRPTFTKTFSDPPKSAMYRRKAYNERIYNRYHPYFGHENGRPYGNYTQRNFNGNRTVRGRPWNQGDQR